jgi:hypothetical protein
MPRLTKGKRQNKVVQTRQDGDTAAAKIDRTISQMRAGESSCMVLCKSAYALSTSTTAATSVVVTYPEIASSDDFVSLAQQFNMFRIKCMRFDLSHTNPSFVGNVVASTVHSNLVGAIPTGWTSEQSVVDGPDSLYISPGSVREVFYWNGTGVSETEFQDVSTYNNHGGFRAYLPQQTAASTAGVVVVSAVVIFKGRK